jgi:hypothetical protein
MASGRFLVLICLLHTTVDADILVSLEDCVTTVLSPEQVLLATNRGDMYAT